MEAGYWIGKEYGNIQKLAINLRYSPGGVIISMKSWNRIPEKYHRALDEMMPKFERGLNEYVRNS